VNRIERIRSVLETAFKPSRLSIEDDSAKHAGHAGARHGGHYRVEIVADAFEGKPPIARHRMVYDALADMMRTDIHALSIQARTPSE
jgi:BolA protein